jgi:predicted enzyme related to lactoylglutathione lyase
MSESNDSQSMGPGQFGWNELLSTDVEASKKFYTGLFGWTTAPGPGPDYTVFMNG